MHEDAASAGGPRDRSALAGVLVAVVAISFAGVLTRWAFEGGAEPLAVAFWRTFAGAVVLAPAALRTPSPAGRRHHRLTVIAGAFLGLHFALWLSSLELTTVASSVTLVTMSPVFVGLGASRLLGEVVTRRTWVGMGVALAGAVAIGLGDGLDIELGTRAIAGDTLALAGAMAVAGYLVAGRVVRQQVPLAWYASRTYAWAAGLLLVTCLITGTPVWGWDAQAWWAIAGIVVGPQLLGHTVLNNLLDRVPPTTISIAVLAEPVGATLLAWLLLSELPADLFWVAAPVVLAGIALASTMARSRTRAAEQTLEDHGAHDDHDDLDDASEWDERYGSEERVWSGQPNGTLVVEVEALSPGRALDVGCGEGADAIWLAHRGWRVTAVDVSRVAIDRASAAGDAAGVDVTWVCTDVTAPGSPLGQHDLVSCQYPALRKDRDGTIPLLLDAVAPGGTLLFVHHAHLHDDEHEHGFDPDDYVQPRDVAAALGDGWVVEVDETRPRPGPLSPDARHVDDVILRARRR